MGATRGAAALALLALLAGPARAAGAVKERERPRCRAHTACTETGVSSNEIFYSVNDVKISMAFKDTEYLVVWCNSGGAGTVPADEPALPALQRPVSVDKVIFRGCLPPARPGGSYAAALAALNVTVEATRHLVLDQQPLAPPLTRAHLSRLRLHTLNVSVPPKDPLQPEDDFLDDVQELLVLILNNVSLKAATLLALPPTLRNLSLTNARLPAAEPGAPRWLARLRALRTLSLLEQGAGAAGGRLAPPPLSALPDLTELYLRGGMAPPPPRWLHNSSLKTLALDSCGLTELPDDIFQRVNLTSLRLSRNKLTDLPRGVFSKLSWLSSLDLSGNKLSGAALASTLPALARLRVLRASGNPLGSLCGDTDGYSGRELSGLPAGLRRLELRGTNATRVCADWVDQSALEYIDLQNNTIEYLTYADVAMVRSAPPPTGAVELLLGRNPLSVLDIKSEDLAACRAPSLSTRVQVELTLDALACDCRHAWLRAALTECASLLVARGASCASPPAALAGPARDALMDYEPDDLLCRYDEDCVPGCACGKRARDNATVVRCSGALPERVRWPAAAARWPLALHVPGAGLRRVPRAPLVELHAANNSITTLDAEDIPETLQVLDVSYNSISNISEAAAALLARVPSSPASSAPPGAGSSLRRVLLKGNLLSCDCAHRAALVHLKFAKTLVEDWSELRCADSRYVRALDAEALCRGVLLPALLGASFVLLACLGAALVLRRLRPRIKQLLFDRQLCLRWVLRADDAADDPHKTHDVFVSYPYPDHALAMRLMRRLEARGYTTVEHCRDWTPGTPVSEHIAHSVLCARRTLLLVSDHFASSKWALDEFRAAHAHALERGSARVLVVRCGLREPHLLPPDLQLYLYNNTYLSWDDPLFWDKLWRVMPPLRTAAKAEAAPPADTELPLSAQEVLAPAELAHKELPTSIEVVSAAPAGAAKEPVAPTPSTPRACNMAPLPTRHSLAPRAAPAAC